MKLIIDIDDKDYEKLNVLSVYEDDNIGEDWLCVIDDIIKGFIEMENK